MAYIWGGEKTIQLVYISYSTPPLFENLTVPSTESGSVSISLTLHGLTWKLKTCGGTHNKRPGNCVPSRGGRGNEHTLTLLPATVTYGPRLALFRYRSRPRLSVCIYDIRIPLDHVYPSSSATSLLFSTHPSSISPSFNILFCLFIIIHPHSSFPSCNRAYCDLLVFATDEIQTHVNRYIGDLDAKKSYFLYFSTSVKTEISTQFRWNFHRSGPIEQNSGSCKLKLNLV